MFRTNRYGEVTALSASDPLRDETFGAKWLVDAEVSYQVINGLSVAVGSNITCSMCIQISSSKGTVLMGSSPMTVSHPLVSSGVMSIRELRSNYKPVALKID